jgi:hypothetical protein
MVPNYVQFEIILEGQSGTRMIAFIPITRIFFREKVINERTLSYMAHMLFYNGTFQRRGDRGAWILAIIWFSLNELNLLF